MKTTLRQLVAVSAFAAGLSAAISTAQSAVVNWNFEGVWTSVTGITEPGTFSGSLSYDDSTPPIDASGEDFSFFTYNSAQLTSLNSFGSTIAFTNPSSSIITARSEFGGYWQFGLSTPEGEVIVDGEGTGAFGLFEIMNRGDLDLDINPDVVDPTSIEVGLIVEFPESQLARTIRTSLFAQGYLTAFTRGGGDPSPVPVPAALPLLAAAIGAIGIVGRRRKSANR
jgi:hypothetical protein